MSFVEVHKAFPRVQIPSGLSSRLPGELIETTAAGERIDAAAGLVTTVGDLHLFGRALFHGELIEPATQGWLMSVASGLENEPVGTGRLAVLRAYHKPYGVLITAEGDGPGGAVTLLAYHPATGAIIVGFTNIFGLFDEADFMLSVTVPDLIDRLEPG